MWLVTVVGVFALINVSIASNFYVNTESGCGTPMFYRDHGNALLNHVIKTLPLFLPDCMTACQETLSCFSINYYKNQSFMCDLNRSTKTQDPESFVRMSGYEYAEAKEKIYCENGKCHSKDALSGGWFSLGTSLFKFNSEEKTWQDSKQHCQTLGAKLASFESQLEHRFVVETINMTSTTSTTTTTTAAATATAAPSSVSPTATSAPINSGGNVLVAVKMDGTDPSGTLNLYNGASVVDIDAKKAVFFDGVDDYATVPRFAITGDLTIAFWMKGQVLTNKYLFSDFDAATNKAMFRIYVSLGKVAFSFQSSGGAFIVPTMKSTSDAPIGTWVHLAITWNKSTKEAKIFFDGNLEKSSTSSASDLTTYQTSNTHFELGARKAGSLSQMEGYMRELYVTAKDLSQAEIMDLKDNGISNELEQPEPATTSSPVTESVGGGLGGTWIGLNDVTTDGTFQWSDETPLTYSKLQSSDNTIEKDCVYLPKDADMSSKWMIAECTQKKPFLCKKK